VVRQHKRFALRNVTYAGVPLPGATMDLWEDDRGNAQWSVRVVARFSPLPDEGELAGQTLDGQQITGHVTVAEREVAWGGRRETVVEFHGSGKLNRSGTGEPAGS
jgi:hypothetical protein